MRTPVWVGITLIVCAVLVLVVGSVSGLFPNLTETVQIVVVSLVPSMFVSGASLIWLGRKPDEQELRRKQDTFGAIERWNETPFGSFRSRRDTLPLAESPPELGVDIDSCLRHYPSVYANLQKLRTEYKDWKETDSVHRFTTIENGIPTVNTSLVNSYDDDMCRRLVKSHHNLKAQMKSEILDKHYTSLKV
jgi:hypothetical protein